MFRISKAEQAQLVGYACIIDRTNGKSEIKDRIVSQIQLNIPTFKKENLPKELINIKPVKPEVDIFNEKIRLGVNIDHVATVRNARGEEYPSPLRAAILAEKNGADSVTIHLREDRRHINELDLKK